MPEPTPPELLGPLSDRDTRPPGQLLWLGRLLPNKGIQIALDAMIALGGGYHLTVIGDGPSRLAAEEFSTKHGIEDRVTFVGHIPWSQVVYHLDRARILLFTSIRDTTGAQILEAAARGVPIVGIDHQGQGDYVPAEAGRLAPLDTPKVLARSLAALVREVDSPSHWSNFSRGARRFAEANSVEARVHALEAFYRDAIGGSH